MKNLVISTISFSFTLLFLIGVIIFFFWYFGIFKQEPKLSEEVLKIKSQTEYVQNYSFQEASKYLLKLNQQIIQLPEIATSELGKSFLFERSSNK